MAETMQTPLSTQQEQTPLAPQTPVPKGQEEMPANMNMQESAEMAGGEKDVPPALKRKMELYNTALMHAMHNPKTSKSVVEMLKAAPAEQSIPSVALQLTDTVGKSFEKGGQKLEESVKLSGAMYLVGDLAEIGNSAGLWEKPVTDQDGAPLLQNVITKYIHEGLRNKTIDPIQLQSDAASLFNEKQTEVGTKIQQGLGMPSEPTASMGIDAYTAQKTAPLEAENAKLKGMLQGQTQGRTDVQQGGPNSAA